MPINIGQPFKRTSSGPIDMSLTLTKAEMLAVKDSEMPAKYFTICQEDGQVYLYDKSATPSAQTGKFKLLEAGGTESMELTQAEYDALSDDEKMNGTIYFITDGQGGGGGSTYTAGDGIDITNDVISTDDMTEAEMTAVTNEVFGSSVVPDTMGYDQIYSTAEQVVGKWVDGRPLYQKTIDTGAMPSTLSGTTYYKAVAHNIADMDFATSVEGFAVKTDYTVCVFPYIIVRADNNNISGWSAYATRSEVRIQANANHSATYTKTYVTIKYVKTTD